MHEYTIKFLDHQINANKNKIKCMFELPEWKQVMIPELEIMRNKWNALAISILWIFKYVKLLFYLSHLWIMCHMSSHISGKNNFTFVIQVYSLKEKLKINHVLLFAFVFLFEKFFIWNYKATKRVYQGVFKRKSDSFIDSRCQNSNTMKLTLLWEEESQGVS